jgi:hypothetical protein
MRGFRSKIFGVVLSLIGVSSAMQAQVMRCATDEIHENLEHRGLFSAQDFKALVGSFAGLRNTSDSLIIIPVVVHVVHNGGISNISDAQVHDAIRVLNEDFLRMNADTINTRAIFQSVAANTRIEFRLAKLDPDGMCTSGIVRHFHMLAGNLPNNIKEILSWDNNMYLNIFVGLNLYPGGLLGYAFYPNPGQDEVNDGVMMLHSAMGAIGSATTGAPYNLGRTLSHEVGHILALPHTFDSGCIGGDNIADTPPVDQANFGCGLNINSCSNDTPNLPDQVENYMDYSNDNCMNMFTAGQKNVMRGVLGDMSLRGYYATPSNLLATGVLDTTSSTCNPLPDFYPSTQVICAGDTLTLTSNGYNGEADSIFWLIPGSGMQSSDSLAKVVYSTPGTYDVGLQVFKNGVGNSILRSDFLVVLPATGKDITFGHAESFENATGTFAEWNLLHSGLGSRWERTDQGAFSGSHSMYVNGFHQAQNFNDYSYDQENLFFPPFDMTTLDSNMVLRFKYAYAPGDFGIDQLNLQMRWSCTMQWATRISVTGAALETISNHPTDQPFFPAGPQDWKQVEIPLNALLNRTHMMFRFQYVNAGGNNLFIDDVEIVPQGLSSAQLELPLISIFPNPFSTQFSISSPIEIRQVVVVDISGRTLLKHMPNANPFEFFIDGNAWPSGVYFCEMATDRGTVRQKLVKY